MRDLFSQLSHYNATTATRHLFLLTNSCGGCNRQKCDLCSSWQSVPTALAACPEDSASCGPRLALTLGPNSPLDTPTRLRQVPRPISFSRLSFLEKSTILRCWYLPTSWRRSCTRLAGSPSAEARPPRRRTPRSPFHSTGGKAV